MLARVQNDSKFSDSFPVSSGVKQSCVYATSLFDMMFPVVLTGAFQTCEMSRFDGSLFHLRPLQAYTTEQVEIAVLIFVDNTVNRVCLD